MAQTVYTVHSFRWGTRRGRSSYIVGVYSSESRAFEAVTREEVNRGGKYNCEVLRWTLDIGEDTVDDACEVVHPLPSESEEAP